MGSDPMCFPPSGHSVWSHRQCEWRWRSAALSVVQVAQQLSGPEQPQVQPVRLPSARSRLPACARCWRLGHGCLWPGSDHSPEADHLCKKVKYHNEITVHGNNRNHCTWQTASESVLCAIHSYMCITYKVNTQVNGSTSDLSVRLETNITTVHLYNTPS